MLRPTTSDHRNRRVPLLPYTAFLPFPRNPERSARLARAYALPQPRISRRELIHALAYALPALPVIYLLAQVPARLSRTNLPFWIQYLIVISLGAIPALIFTAILRRVAADRLAGYYSAAGYCASCAYDLKAATPEPDGCRICPECGAAWRLPSPSP